MKPVKRRELLRKLSALGFSQPKGRGKHQFVQRDNQKITIPNPHGGDVKTATVRQIIRQLGLTEEEWNRL